MPLMQQLDRLSGNGRLTPIRTRSYGVRRCFTVTSSTKESHPSEVARWSAPRSWHKGDERRYPAHIVHGSEWVPTLATATGEIYFTTGNAGTTCTEPLSTAMVQASSDLALLASRQVPASSHRPDCDFGGQAHSPSAEPATSLPAHRTAASSIWAAAGRTSMVCRLPRTVAALSPTDGHVVWQDCPKDVPCHRRRDGRARRRC